jgi:hypothetical protein
MTLRSLLLLLVLAAASLSGTAGLRAQQSAPLPPAATGPTTPAQPAQPGTPTSRPAPSTAIQRDGGTLAVSAILGGQAGPIRGGIKWRVFRDSTSAEEQPVLVTESESAAPVFVLEPGIYYVHATYGLASATKRIVMGTAPTTESLVINAGGLVLAGNIGDTLIPPDRLSFNIYVPIGNDPEGRLVLENARAGTLIRLPEGTYRVVSNYGDSNAIQTADLRVEAGKVTEATLRHKAATITLKLVMQAGAEALANTTFSVLTPGGDTIREAIGAFPSMTLAEGEYVVIARNSGKVYTQEFSVKSGLDRDVEVLVKEAGASPTGAPAAGTSPAN